MKILAVSAHPGDVEFVCAGTLAKYKRLGHGDAMATATNGEIGSSTLPKAQTAAVRHAEAAASAAVLEPSSTARLPKGTSVATRVAQGR